MMSIVVAGQEYSEREVSRTGHRSLGNASVLKREADEEETHGKKWQPASDLMVKEENDRQAA